MTDSVLQRIAARANDNGETAEAEQLDDLGVFGFGAMMIFLVVLGVAYFYEIRRGGLEWD